MEYPALIESLQVKFGSCIISADIESDFPSIEVDAESVKNIISHLKKEENFIFLTDLCGIHYPEQALEFGVIYHLHNLVDNQRLRIKAFVSRENPKIDSITSLYSGANWMERETFDFYGIEFKGHPNLTRILNVEYMDYHPMRKEFPLEDATRTDKDDRYFGR